MKLLKQRLNAALTSRLSLRLIIPLVAAVLLLASWSAVPPPRQRPRPATPV
jgi:hypothetical protein